MELTRRQTWWLTFGLFALQGLTSFTWGSIGIPKEWLIGISSTISYMQTLLMFALHGSLPGTSGGQAALQQQSRDATVARVMASPAGEKALEKNGNGNGNANGIGNGKPPC